MQQLLGSLEAMGATLAEAGYDVRPVIVEPPATEGEVEALEADLGFPLPASFRTALLTISRHVEFRWSAPGELCYPEPFGSNFSGDLHWSLDLCRQHHAEAQSWITIVFPDPGDPYGGVWHDKLAFYEVGNGDFLAVDLAEHVAGHIVYLSHDDGEGHGHVLASSLADLVDRWTLVACTGGEDWQWLPFTEGLRSMIDGRGEAAQRWRSLLGLTT